MAMAVDWSELLPDLLFEIAQKLPFYEDFISFSNVCFSWQSAAASESRHRFYELPSRYPSIMVTGEGDQDDVCRILHMDGGFVRTVRLPKRNLLCRAAFWGWLLTIDENQFDAKLLHLLSGRQIDLPSLDTLPEEEYDNDRGTVQKVVLSSDPNTSKEEDFLVIIIWGNKWRLAFCRPGDPRWTPVFGEPKNETTEDMFYHNGMVYSLQVSFHLFALDIHSRNDRPFMSKFAESRPSGMKTYLISDITNNYIIGLDNKLLVVMRGGELEGESSFVPDKFDYFDNYFLVFEFDLTTKEWSKLDDLGNRALFVGFNSSFSVEAHGCIKPNCIYFKNDGVGCRSNIDNGIYHLCDGKIERDFGVKSFNKNSPITWI